MDLRLQVYVTVLLSAYSSLFARNAQWHSDDVLEEQRGPRSALGFTGLGSACRQSAPSV